MSLDNYIQLITKSYSTNHAKKFTESNLHQDNTSKLKKSCQDIMQMLPPQPFQCALLSATLVEYARQAGIACYLAAGSLDFKGKRLFNYDPIVEHNNIVENWNGHCWVIFNGVIAEISLFRTSYSEEAPQWLTNMVSETFGRQSGCIIDTISGLESIGLVYTPHYIFDDLKLSGLLNSVEQIISKTWNYPVDVDTCRIACPVPGFSSAIALT